MTLTFLKFNETQITCKHLVNFLNMLTSVNSFGDLWVRRDLKGVERNYYFVLISFNIVSDFFYGAARKMITIYIELGILLNFFLGPSRHPLLKCERSYTTS